jgi:hypothetical protein
MKSKNKNKKSHKVKLGDLKPGKDPKGGLAPPCGTRGAQVRSTVHAAQ